MFIGASKLRKRRSHEKRKRTNSRDRHCNMTLHLKETIKRVRKKQCTVSNRMYYLKFTCKYPEYTRNIVLYDSLADKKLSDCFFSNWITLESLEL